VVYRITPEQRALYNERARLRAAEKALAAGRTPGKKGQPPKNRTPEEKAALHRERTRRYYFENHEKMKAYRAEWARKKAAENAIAEGREPGKPGRRARPAEESRALKSARTKKNYYERLEHSRAMAARREREKRAAKKAGTYKPKKVKLTDEQRRLVNVNLGHARRARLKAADGKWNISDLKTMRWRQNGICPICNRLLGDHGLSVDHWVPLAKGGSNGTENMRLTHGSCNFSKGARHPDTLRQPYEVVAA
jgi:HNH endonuclease